MNQLSQKHHAADLQAEVRINMSPELFRKLLEISHTTGMPPMKALQELIEAGAAGIN